MFGLSRRAVLMSRVGYQVRIYTAVGVIKLSILS